MTASLSNLQAALQDALDDLTSPRTPSATKLAALRALEHTLARATCVTPGEDALLEHFLALQHTFECNLPSRILGWMAGAIPRLEALPAADADSDSDAEDVAAQLALALSIIQGVALLHAPSKTWLGRSYALDLLIDLFLASRHLPSPSPSPSPSSTSSSSTPTPPPPLASTTLDTLLCILVDSPAALRLFEARRGLHAVVRILKRAGTPRGVRMKCLEFLYFYLLDETPGPDTPNPGPTSTTTTTTPTPPPPPPTPSTKHNTPTPPTPQKQMQKQMQNYKTPKPRALMMLRRDVEYVPLSPAKRVHVGSDSGIEYVPLSPEKPAMQGVRAGLGSASGSGEGWVEGKREGAGEGEGDVRKTTEEKKMLLGTMLGNVDALVEGVRRAGVWGLR